jgi:hypothetical protein
MFHHSVYGRLIYTVIYISDGLLTQETPYPHYAAPPDLRRPWMEENGWPLNRTRTAIHPNLLPAWVQRRTRVLNEEVVILELVFFTRFELRKGIVLFCDLLDQLALRAGPYSRSFPLCSFMVHTW